MSLRIRHRSGFLRTAACASLVALTTVLLPTPSYAEGAESTTGLSSSDGEVIALSHEDELPAVEDLTVLAPADFERPNEKMDVEISEDGKECSPEDSQGRILCIGFGDAGEALDKDFLREKDLSMEVLEDRLESAQASDLVSWCDSSIRGNEFKRFEACLKDFTPMIAEVTVRGVPVGEAAWAVQQEVKLEPKESTVEQSILLVPLYVEESLVSITLNWVPETSCISDCTRPTQSWDNSLTWFPGDLHSSRGTATFSWTKGEGKTDFLMGWSIEGYSPTAPTDPSRTSWGTNPPMEVRCDKLLGGNLRAGCSFPSYTPSLVYSMSSDYSDVVYHIAVGVEMGMPNPRHNALTRLQDSVLIDRNRTRACKSSYPRPEGMSCDEFPFASTYQGAYTADPDGNTLRPTEIFGCHIDVVDPVPPWSDLAGYSVCMVDAEHNRKAGEALKEFYDNNRVLDSDPFYVDITR